MNSPAASSSPNPAVSAGPVGEEEARGERSGSPGSAGPAPAAPLWVRIVPFFFSAVLFLSAVFAIFAPLPILFSYFRAGRRWAVLVALTNAALVAALAGSPSLLVYAAMVALPALVLSEGIVRTRSIEKSAAWALGTLALAVGAGVAAYFQFRHSGPWVELKNELSLGLDTLIHSVPEGRQSLLGSGVPEGLHSLTPEEIEEWKKGIFLEMPSAIAVLALVMIWSNVLMLFRMNPGHVRDRVLRLPGDFFQRWKAPELLVWPTLVAGLFLLVEVPYVSITAVNAFKFLMAIYALQGLSVLSAFFLAWGVRGAWRSLGYGVAVFVMMPLLLSLGFFDLWFDFRAKFRQS